MSTKTSAASWMCRASRKRSEKMPSMKPSPTWKMPSGRKTRQNKMPEIKEVSSEGSELALPHKAEPASRPSVRIAPHPTVQERIELGRGVRKQIPREAHAAWEAKPDRRDPIEL